MNSDRLWRYWTYCLLRVVYVLYNTADSYKCWISSQSPLTSNILWAREYWKLCSLVDLKDNFLELLPAFAQFSEGVNWIDNEGLYGFNPLLFLVLVNHCPCGPRKGGVVHFQCQNVRRSLDIWPRINRSDFEKHVQLGIRQTPSVNNFCLNTCRDYCISE